VLIVLSRIDIALGFKALASPNRALKGVPFFMLWRMCFALFIAAGSFFSIRERVANW
jgi:hypothetical protein